MYSSVNWYISIHISGLPRWHNGKKPTCQCRRPRFVPWVGNIPWRRKWHSTPVDLPGKFHGQRSLAGYTPCGHEESHNLVTRQQHSYQWGHSSFDIWLPSTMIVVVESLSCVRLFVTQWTAAHQTSLFFTISRSLLRLMCTESLCHPTVLSSVVPFISCLQSFPASGSFLMNQLYTSGG